MKKILRLYAVLLAIASCVHTVEAQTLHEFAPDKVELKPSWVKEREQMDIDFIRSLDPDRLLHTFRLTAGIPSDAEPLGGWESPGVGLRGQDRKSTRLNSSHSS